LSNKKVLTLLKSKVVVRKRHTIIIIPIFKSIFMVLFMLTSMVVKAQQVDSMAQKQKERIYCVISAEGKVPMRDVVIHTNTEHWAMTDYTGRFMMKYDWDSATVSKPGFVEFKIYAKSIQDTIVMIPNARHISEVEVWGKDMQQQNLDRLSKSARDAAKDAAKPGGIQVDMLGWMDRRGKRDAKHLKKAAEVIDSLNSKQDIEEDPIIRAYIKTTGKKYKGKENTTEGSK
jgi:hypothetical protein